MHLAFVERADFGKHAGPPARHNLVTDGEALGPFPNCNDIASRLQPGTKGRGGFN